MPLKRSITAVTCGRFPKCSPAHLPSSFRRHNTVSRLRQHRARLPRVRYCFFMFSVDICTDCIFSASSIRHFVHNSQSYCRLFFLSLRIFDMDGCAENILSGSLRRTLYLLYSFQPASEFQRIGLNDFRQRSLQNVLF